MSRQELYDQGVRSLADFAKLKGKKVGVGAVGSINQYNVAQGAAEGRSRSRQGRAVDRQRAAAGPHEMLGQSQVDVTDLAYQFGLFAQNNKWGPIIANGDQIAPNAAIATFAVRKDYLQKNRDAVIRWPWPICKA